MIISRLGLLSAGGAVAVLIGTVALVSILSNGDTIVEVLPTPTGESVIPGQTATPVRLATPDGFSTPIPLPRPDPAPIVITPSPVVITPSPTTSPCQTIPIPISTPMICLDGLQSGAQQQDGIVLQSRPVYGGDALFHIHLSHHYQLVKWSLACLQVPQNSAVWVYRSEQALDNALWSHGEWDGDVSQGPLRSPSPLPSVQADWNPVLPASCVAVVFRETAKTGKGPMAITSTSFMVEPVS